MICVIFGAGKIARGFIGHLLHLSGLPFVFVEKNDELADLINDRGRYTVNVLGAPERSTTVKNARALKFSDREEIASAIAGAELVFTAVGGKNLAEIAPFLAQGIELRAKAANPKSLNIITCENWKQPAKFLREEIGKIIAPGAAGYLKEHTGAAEAVVMRSAIEPDAEALALDPLAVNVQDYWELPVDASGIAGVIPDFPGLKLTHDFAGFLERKFYTYNAANATVSYIGVLLGHKKIADAAHDGRVLEILYGVYEETSAALSAKHNFPIEEQRAFAKTSLAKLQDRTIVDNIERNARDPIRKLGPDDRLVGSARLVLEHGLPPHNLATSIAAAIHYTEPADPFAHELEDMRNGEGVDAVLSNVCGLDPQGELGALVKKKIGELKKRGWILHER